MEAQNTSEEADIVYIYEWIDKIPLSRKKRNIARDFSDGVLLAEVIKHYLPKMVDIHNYSYSTSTNQKSYNWQTLNSIYYILYNRQGIKENWGIFKYQGNI